MFKVGDKVVSEEFGEGVVISVTETFAYNEERYSVKVDFPHKISIARYQYYTKDGAFYDVSHSFYKENHPRNIKLKTCCEGKALLKEEEEFMFKVGDQVISEEFGKGAVLRVKASLLEKNWKYYPVFVEFCGEEGYYNHKGEINSITRRKNDPRNIKLLEEGASSIAFKPIHNIKKQAYYLTVEWFLNEDNQLCFLSKDNIVTRLLLFSDDNPSKRDIKLLKYFKNIHNKSLK